MKTMTIVEIGACHDGDPLKGVKLIEAAKAAGADYAKAQFWSSAKRLAERRQSGSEYEAIYERYQVPGSWLHGWADAAKRVGIGFMSTCYLKEDIGSVDPHVAHFKVASFEAADEEFIRAHFPYCEGTDRQIIVSTGLQDNRTLQSLKILRHCAATAGSKSVQVRLLHCVSAYPAPVSSLAFRQIRNEDLDGFSDHAAAGWIASGAVAVACGAKIIEVHLRLPETDAQNPDAPHALLPEQLARYIRHVRAAEAAIGDEPWRKLNPAEDAMRPYRVKPEEATE